MTAPRLFGIPAAEAPSSPTADGRLLVATDDGRLQVRDGLDGRRVLWETDVSGLTPDPQPPPAEAARW